MSIQKMKEGINELCTGCFAAHFPQPNMMNCKFKNRKKIKEKSFHFIRLRGGAHTKGSSCSMIEKAIANAKAHNINLTAGDRTPGDGN